MPHALPLSEKALGSLHPHQSPRPVIRTAAPEGIPSPEQHGRIQEPVSQTALSLVAMSASFFAASAHSRRPPTPRRAVILPPKRCASPIGCRQTRRDQCPPKRVCLSSHGAANHQRRSRFRYRRRARFVRRAEHGRRASAATGFRCVLLGAHLYHSTVELLVAEYWFWIGATVPEARYSYGAVQPRRGRDGSWL
jgi:hypothetical protein